VARLLSKIQHWTAANHVEKCDLLVNCSLSLLRFFEIFQRSSQHLVHCQLPEMHLSMLVQPFALLRVLIAPSSFGLVLLNHSSSNYFIRNV